MARVFQTSTIGAGILLLAGFALPAAAAAQEQAGTEAQAKDRRAPSRPLPRGTPRLSAGSPLPANVYYADCEAVRSAGAAPLRRGEPGYHPQLDRDGDGVACEPYARQALNTRG